MSSILNIKNFLPLLIEFSKSLKLVQVCVPGGKYVLNFMFLGSIGIQFLQTVPSEFCNQKH